MSDAKRQEIDDDPFADDPKDAEAEFTLPKPGMSKIIM